MRRVISLVALGLLGAGAVIACGARGPLDVDVIYVIAEGGAEGGTTDADGTDTTDALASQDTGTKPVDAGTDVATPINCALCVGQSCSNQILSCVTNQACLGTLQCVFTQCLNGGSVSPACALGCSGEGGAQGILDVLAILECVTQSCGPDCTSVISGLGGGIGGGGAGGN